jgi:hypothetical protein
VLWGFMRRYAPEASPETHPGLDAAAGYAVRYYNDFVKPTRVFRAPDAREAAALADLRDRLAVWTGPVDPEALQAEVYAVGKRPRLRAAARLVPLPLPGAARLGAGPAVRRLRRALRRRRNRFDDRRRTLGIGRARRVIARGFVTQRSNNLAALACRVLACSRNGEGRAPVGSSLDSIG